LGLFRLVHSLKESLGIKSTYSACFSFTLLHKIEAVNLPMLNTLRWIIGHAAMMPFTFSYFALSVLLGRRKALSLVGKALSNVSVMSLGTIIPEMHNNDSFSDFKSRIIRNFSNYKLLYDVEIQSESDDFVEFKVLNCPFTSALKNFGTPELCRFACAGDFIIAKRNRSRWKFSRTHSHGTDGICCNHTYFSLDCKREESVDGKIERPEEKERY
jgi:hypothetical protein